MRAAIQALIADCLAGPVDPARLERTALTLCAWQRDHSPAYAALCGGAEPRDLVGIPAVPVGLFREADFTCFPPPQAAHVFHTSGTTAGRPGRHRLLDTRTYDLASTGWFRACLPGAPRRCLSLVPSPALNPHSSLSHMVALLFPAARWCAGADGLVDAEAAWGWLSAQVEPVFLASTSLGLASLLEAEGRCDLPAGSVIMTTGGFKGRRLALDAGALLARARERLGRGIALIGEYGMTELSSQLWTRAHGPATPPAACAEAPYLPPPWLVPLIVDPGTGAPLPAGALGQIRFVDLANDHTVLAIETMDQGALLPDGSLRLHGRLPGAEARGCSLTVEEALEARLGGR
ncbi:MAG: acyl-protein synthetase [Pseudomonadota bacterium]